MYRIISGKWKAKRISAPKNFDVRPTTDFAKEALFSILSNEYDFAFCSVLDLFAGIGSLTLEFASRGCKDVTAVEMNPRHAYFIEETAENLDMGDQIRVERGDVYSWLKKQTGAKQYEIIVADPPFDSTSEEDYTKLIDLIFEKNLLKPNGVFVLEHQSRNPIEDERVDKTKKYGNITFSFFYAKEA